MNEIFEKAQSFKYNSVAYKDLEDIGQINKENTFDMDNGVFIIQDNNKEVQIHWGAETEEAYFQGIKKVLAFIEAKKKADKRIFIEFIPPEFVKPMEEFGFNIVSEWVDFWVRDLQSIEMIPSDFKAVRFIRAEEYEEASNVLFSCKGYSREFNGKFGQWLKEWSERLESCILVAEIDNELVGVCCLNMYGFESEKGAVLWLRIIGVYPKYQGKGIGYALIERAFQWGKENGAKRSFLACDAENHKGIKLYEKFGYRRREERGQINMTKK